MQKCIIRIFMNYAWWHIPLSRHLGGRGRTRLISVIEARLVCKTSFRTDRANQGNIVLEAKKKRKNDLWDLHIVSIQQLLISLWRWRLHLFYMEITFIWILITQQNKWNINVIIILLQLLPSLKYFHLLAIVM